jgi:hypothetical protein
MCDGLFTLGDRGTMDKLLARIEEAPEAATRRLLGREFHRTVQRYTADVPAAL